MCLEPPAINEIVTCISSLGANKVVGHDSIPAYFLKIAALTLAPYLCTLIDYAFTFGIFPVNCKIAKVIPIHKKGDKNNPTNYSLISILTCFSKIIEEMIYKKTFGFTAKNEIVY